jgi:hypothetical protein
MGKRSFPANASRKLRSLVVGERGNRFINAYHGRDEERESLSDLHLE